MKNKFNTLNRVLILVLLLAMISGIMSVTAFADGTYTFPSLSQSGDNNSTLRSYLTDENAGDMLITDYQAYVSLALKLDDGWYFEKWDTYFNGYEDVPVWSDSEVKGANPVSEDGFYTFFNRDQSSPYINESGSKMLIFISQREQTITATTVLRLC